MSMRFLRLFKRKTRWMRQVDAYVDERLTPIERDLLEERIAESDDVREMLEETRAIKRGLAGMPEHQPRRSFAITPGMLAEPRPEPAPSRIPVVTMRLGQATAFAAMAALAITGAIHFDQATTSETYDDAAPAMTDAVSDQDALGEADTFATEDEAAPPAAEDGEPLRDADGPTITGDAAEAPEPVDDARHAAPAEAPDRPEPATVAPDTTSRDFIPIYGALGSALVLAAGLWAFSRRRVKGRDL